MRSFVVCNLICAFMILLGGCKENKKNNPGNSVGTSKNEITKAENNSKKLSSYYGEIKDALGKRLPIEVYSAELSEKILISKDSPYYDKITSEILRIESNETKSSVVNGVPSSPDFVIRIYSNYESKEVRATVIYYPGLIEVVPYAIQTRDDLMVKIRDITAEALGKK